MHSFPDSRAEPFFFPQAAQFFLTEPTFQQELPEDVRQLRVP
jgi:hypothetical protein